MDIKDMLFYLPASEIIKILLQATSFSLNMQIDQLFTNFTSNLNVSLEKLFSIFQELSISSGNKNLTLALMKKLKEVIQTQDRLKSLTILDYCKENYLNLDPDCLQDFFTIIDIHLSKENLVNYSIYLILCGMTNKAKTLMNNFELTDMVLSKFDLVNYLASKGQNEMIFSLCKGNKSLVSYSIECLCKYDMSEQAEEMIKSFKLDHKQFPSYQKKVKKKCLKHFILRDRSCVVNIIELLHNDYIGMGALIEILLDNYTKNGFWMLDLASALLYSYPDIMKEPTFKLNSSVDIPGNFLYIPPDGRFGPVLDGCCQLPSTFNVVFIDTLDKINSLTWVSNSVVGIDSEWRTSIGGKLEETKNSILQIACVEVIYIIDLLITQNRKELDIKLYQLFGNASIIKVGVALEGDMMKLKESHPDLICFQQPLKSYLDLINVHKRMYKTDPGGLNNLCEIHLKFSLCKSEQKSNWELRPLRDSQLHYAALDAFICLKIYSYYIEKNILIQDDLILELAGSDKRVTNNLPLHKKTCETCSSRLHYTQDCPKYRKCEICGYLDHTTNICPCVHNLANQ